MRLRCAIIDTSVIPIVRWAEWRGGPVRVRETVVPTDSLVLEPGHPQVGLIAVDVLDPRERFTVVHVPGTIGHVEVPNYALVV